ncbi:Cullin-4A [Hyphodiscus hymeniophilus]|uniref:Cullin-4A n=1 Tax=Hyphodiscus hymeniophilus TaxID=353542 RepID=A0A9P7AXC1_9HELO|nr:Cullin-4A [Hyphodiscus hymeniophilus]
MNPPPDPSNTSISTSSKTASKRKLSEQQHKSPASKASRQTPSSLTNGPTAHESTPPKRLKTSHSSANIPRPGNMSKTMGLVTRPGFVDLTRGPSNFQPHAGAKKLVIKNQRKEDRKDMDGYYDTVWKKIDNALSAVFEGEVPPMLDRLSRQVEELCRNHREEQIFGHLRERCKAHLEKEVLPNVEREGAGTNVHALRAVLRYWKVWTAQSTLIRSIFSYLDRSYLLVTKDAIKLEDLSISQFRNAIFSKGKGADGRSLGGRVVLGMADLVEYDRNNQETLFDATLLRDSVAMMHIFGIYGKSFEPLFLKLSGEYFKKFVDDRSNSEIKDHIMACDQLLGREALRCDTYNFDSTTKRMLLDMAHEVLVKECTGILLSEKGISKLIDTNATGSLRALYGLLTLSKIQEKLKTPWESHIKIVGASIVGDTSKGDEMVVRLLELKRALDLIIRDSFDKDEAFTYTLREAFSNFINDRKTTQAWGNGNSKVGEMIAKYIDMLLRGGLKAVPRSLAFDAKDRDAAEKQGQASTGDEDAELDRQLEQGLELFRFIEGKDVFEAFYKKDLARRLLMARSASQDAERNMLAKLKAECGFSFTHNLEQMFKDQELARDEMIAYKQSLSNTSKTTLDLQVSVLSSAAWPTYPDVEVKLPPEVSKHIEKYDMHYKHKHSGRRLSWKHALAHAVVRATFNKGAKELVVSGFQAILLVLFNDIGDGGNLSYTDIKAATGLIDAELQRTLQSLACAKFRVLTKHPKGREVNPTDTFTINLGFTDPKYRIKINQIQLKETKEENKETHERVLQDRQYETQAAIVRIMKSRKTMTHASLVAEVIEQTRKRGTVELSEIKANIEKLIEKEYIEREGSSYVYLA